MPGGGKLTHLSFFAKIKKVFKYFPYTMTKSIFRPTSSHWISIFYSSLESLRPKQADCTIFASKFCTNFAQTPLQEIRTFIFLNTHLGFKNFAKIWISCVKGFSNMYNFIIWSVRTFLFIIDFGTFKNFFKVNNPNWQNQKFNMRQMYNHIFKTTKKLKKDWNPFLNWKYILLVFLWKC